MTFAPSCSLIVSTYNWPEALETTLLSVFQQSVMPNEIVVCDDGSEEDTKWVIDKLRTVSPVPLLHVWHPDEGFRKAIIMNKGLAVTTGEYIIEIDQDIILHRHFIKDHLRGCKRGQFLSGNRIYLDPETSKNILASKNVTKPFDLELSKNGMRRLRSSLLRKLMAEFYHWEKEYQYVLGCNMSFWREDFIRVNGYDETFEGWGWEDTDLALRLMNSGVKLVFIRFSAIQFHVYHKEASRTHQELNYLRAMETINGKRVAAEKGVHQYIVDYELVSEASSEKWKIGGNLEKVAV